MSRFITRVHLRHFIAIGAVLGSSLLASHVIAADSKAAKTAPAQDGQAPYTTNCASCHGKALEGSQFAPALSGENFEKKWGGRTDDLLKKITDTMPAGNAGSLDSATYQQIAQYVQNQNHGLAAPAHPAAIKSSVTANSGIADGGVSFPPPEAFEDATFKKIKQDRAALLAKLTPVTEDMLQAPASQDWLSFRGTNARQSFSTLKQVNKSNVGHLGTAWSWPLATGPNEIEPLVHDGVMFVASGTDVQALDAATGTLLWQYRRPDNPKFNATFYHLHRSIAVYGTTVFAATADRHVVALDMKTGAVLWDAEVTPETTNSFLTAGPIVAHGKVIQATSGGIPCVHTCEIVGFDAATGQKLWTFNTIAGPNDPGGNTWNGAAADERSGGGVWSPGSYDPKTGLIYFGIGQTYKAEPLLRAPNDSSGRADGLYTNSTVALDPDTGRLVWHHQHFSRDVWDLDEAYERLLLTVTMPDGPHDALATMGKMGVLDVLDRRTGQFLFAMDSGLQTLVTIDPVTGKRTVKPEFIQPQAGVSYDICPSALGVKNWMTTAYDPTSGVLYLPLHESCMDYTWRPTSKEKHEDIGYVFKKRPDSDGNYGRLAAWDLKAHKPLWVRRTRPAISSSLLATAGGVVFNANEDRTFQAADARTGATLWSVTLDAAANASPITYTVNGEQYVAVVAGNGAVAQSIFGAFNPEIEKGAPATTLWVFKLPSHTK